MGIEIINPKEIALKEKKRTVVMNTRKLHAWVHYYPNPGDHDELHCHNEDQVFTCFEGECTMKFPDGGSAVLKPGMAALITGGSFYQLVNSGDRPHDHDGPPIRQSGQRHDHRLRHPPGYPQEWRTEDTEQPRAGEDRSAGLSGGGERVFPSDRSCTRVGGRVVRLHHRGSGSAGGRLLSQPADTHDHRKLQRRWRL